MTQPVFTRGAIIKLFSYLDDVIPTDVSNTVWVDLFEAMKCDEINKYVGYPHAIAAIWRLMNDYNIDAPDLDKL